jgi:hypothetical protein
MFYSRDMDFYIYNLLKIKTWPLPKKASINTSSTGRNGRKSWD